MAVADTVAPSGHVSGNTDYRLKAYVLTWRAGDWQKPYLVYSYTSVEPYTNLHSVACTSASFCMATTTPAGSIAWDGSRWAAYRGATSGTDGGGMLACAPPLFCVAGIDTGWSKWTGGQWALEPMLPGFNLLITGLACPAEDFCVASDAEGIVDTWDGRSWSEARLIPPPGTVLVVPENLRQLACASASFCLGTEQDDTPVYWDGSGWLELAYEPVVSAQGDIAACSSSACFLVSGQGVVTYQLLTHGPHPAGFYSAREDWLDSASVDSADQGRYWLAAAADLRVAAAEHPGYAAASKALVDMSSLPETDATPAQQSQGVRDMALVNNFFATPYIGS
jgi:hypothetical protein